MGLGFFFRILPIVAAVTAIVYLPIALASRARRGKKPFMRHVVLFSLVCGFFTLIYLTILWYGLSELTFSPEMRFLNLKPFVWLRETYEMGFARMMKQVGLNVLMFVPFGFLLPLAFPRLRAFWKTALAVLCLTLCIETLQYFIGRSADIDDAIMNSLGGVAGYLLYVVCNRLFAKRKWWRHASGSAYGSV